jgi:hypothetical protein
MTFYVFTVLVEEQTLQDLGLIGYQPWRMESKQNE